jgi:hypothetical protein
LFNGGMFRQHSQRSELFLLASEPAPERAAGKDGSDREGETTAFLAETAAAVQLRAGETVGVR